MYVDADDVRLSRVATPLLVIVAAPVLEEVQVTPSVITTLLPSSNVAVATKACVSPEAMEAVVGVTSIDFRFANVMETVVAPLIVPEVAVMLAVPAEMPETKPVLLTVAEVVSEDAQVTELVRVFVLSSL
jgi:hypothetical protein